jgi:hypothetical protein
MSPLVVVESIIIVCCSWIVLVTDLYSSVKRLLVMDLGLFTDFGVLLTGCIKMVVARVLVFGTAWYSLLLDVMC